MAEDRDKEQYVVAESLNQGLAEYCPLIIN